MAWMHFTMKLGKTKGRSRLRQYRPTKVRQGYEEEETITATEEEQATTTREEDDGLTASSTS